MLSGCFPSIFSDVSQQHPMVSHGLMVSLQLLAVLKFGTRTLQQLWSAACTGVAWWQLVFTYRNGDIHQFCERDFTKKHRFSLAKDRISSTCVHSNGKNGSAQGLLAETAAIRSTVSNHVAVDVHGLQLCEISLSSEIGGDLRYYEHEALIFFPAQTSVLNVGILGHAQMDPQKS